jgi:hypothetical protein
MVGLRNIVYMVEFRSENSEGIREFLAGTPYAIIADHRSLFENGRRASNSWQHRSCIRYWLAKLTILVPPRFSAHPQNLVNLYLYSSPFEHEANRFRLCAPRRLVKFNNFRSKTDGVGCAGSDGRI